MGTWSGRDPLADEEGVYLNTPEQRAAALRVVARHADVASFGELVAMLELAG
jgi:hypothetical protein